MLSLLLLLLILFKWSTVHRFLLWVLNKDFFVKKYIITILILVVIIIIVIIIIIFIIIINMAAKGTVKGTRRKMNGKTQWTDKINDNL